jgi:hypothetical protein
VVERPNSLSRGARMWRFGWQLTITLAAMLLGGAMANAQVLYGTVTGTVTDNTGAVIPKTAVTLTNQGTGAVRTAIAGPAGDYRFGDVLPGSYTVSVAASGNFSSFTAKGIAVQVNREIRVDITLQPASVSQTVTVTSAPPELQTETADVNHEITETQLSQLPVSGTQGRNFQSLYTLVPGASNVKEQNSTAANPSRAMSLNVNGVSYNTNTTRIDGAMNYYGWLPYLIAYVPPADSIATVNIDTNSFNAEQGLAGGAVINVTTKSGSRDLHGTAWEYYQDAALSARPYLATQAVQPTIPKNVFNEWGFNLGGPVYIPKVLTGRKKLFFFDNFERTTRRQLITGNLTVPDSKMIGGDFSEVSSIAPLYDPQPGGVGPYLPVGSRPTFLSEYGCNCVPASRISPAAATMIANLQPIASSIGTPSASVLQNQMANDYFGSGTLAYTRDTNDVKITYVPSETTQMFGKYSIEPFSILDPQSLGAAGGGTFDGGQPGAAKGRIQNVGLGFSHVFSPNLLLDWDFGYTRQVTGAQSLLDQKLGDYGTSVLQIPGTNGIGSNYVGQPVFAFGTVGGNAVSNGFSSIGDAANAAPFSFRDNQFTGDVNLSWTKGKHATKYGFTYYHFDLNHFQPTSGSFINNPRGGFAFQGGMTVGPGDVSAKGANSIYVYNMLADYLLGLPNQAGAGPAVAKAAQLDNPNALRWTEIGAYAQDQWTATPKLTVNYGVRYEVYPAPYRDHTGVYILDPNLPQTANVEVGGVNGEPQNAGLSTGYGFFVPRVGVAYRLNDKTVVRSGFGITTDPESFRFLRDSFPMDLASDYYSSAADSIAVDASGAPMTLKTGIPAVPVPNFSTGYASLPVSGSTVTVKKDFHRGYIESWNLFVQREVASRLVANVGYVGTHAVRQFTQTGYLNSAPLPSASTPCMSNGHWNPSTGLTGHCNFNANQIINRQWCTGTANLTCYNTGGIGTVMPLSSSSYNGLQSQLNWNGGTDMQLGISYTYSRAIDLEDNGAGTGSGGLAWNYPGYYKMNRALAGYDQTHNLEIYGIYNLPFGKGHAWANSGISSVILGGWHLNGQFSHTSGFPFAVTANSNTANSPGNPLYANLVAHYRQLGGHARTGGSNVSGGKFWFDPASFGNPTEPSTCALGDSGCASPNGTAATPASNPVFGNTNRNEFRGPGVSYLNASIFRDFPIYHEATFQLRFETFNTTNHPQLTSNPNTTVGSGSFGEITSFGNSRSLQFSGRIQF